MLFHIDIPFDPVILRQIVQFFGVSAYMCRTGSMLIKVSLRKIAWLERSICSTKCYLSKVIETMFQMILLVLHGVISSSSYSSSSDTQAMKLVEHGNCGILVGRDRVERYLGHGENHTAIRAVPPGQLWESVHFLQT